MILMTRRAALAGSLALAARPSLAQGWPDKPIRFLVPYPVGGIVDIVARAVAEPMVAELGQPIVVDPRPGANSTLATAMVPQAPADGYTWVIATLAHVVAPLLQPVSYDPLKDFQGVALVAVADLGRHGECQPAGPRPEGAGRLRPRQSRQAQLSQSRQRLVDPSRLPSC